ncbi:hypothetical protein [Pseudomonas sp. PB3P13]
MRSYGSLIRLRNPGIYQLLEEAFKLFGTRKVCAGVPSNLAAMTANDAATIRHGDFHILGRVVLTVDLAEKVLAILISNPDAQLTADANWLRANTADSFGIVKKFFIVKFHN